MLYFLGRSLSVDAHIELARMKVLNEIAAVRISIDTALADLQKYGTDGGITTNVNRFFLGRNDKRKQLNPNEVKQIAQMYAKVAKAIDTEIITWKLDPKYKYYGYNAGWADVTVTNPVSGKQTSSRSGRVFLGRMYTNDPDSRNRFGTIIHELTHFFGTGDFGYMVDLPRIYDSSKNVAKPLKSPDGKEILVNEQSVVEYVNKYEKSVVLSTETLLNNADTFAGYLTSYYYSKATEKVNKSKWTTLP